MALFSVKILIMDSSTRFTRAKSMVNSVYRPMVHNCWRFPVAVIYHPRNTRCYAPGWLMFRRHRRLLRNTQFRFNTSYYMRSPTLYLSPARPSRMSPVFTNNEPPSPHRSFWSMLHTHHFVKILRTCYFTHLCWDRTFPIRCIGTVHCVNILLFFVPSIWAVVMSGAEYKRAVPRADGTRK